MTRIVLVAHAPLASALLQVATHVFPDCAVALEALDVEPQMSPDQVDDAVRGLTCARSSEDEVLVLADTFGASPANAATRVADGTRVRLVTGVNVPMLWRTLCYRAERLDSLVERAVQGGASGVIQVSAPRPQHQTHAGARNIHDQVQHPDQQ